MIIRDKAIEILRENLPRLRSEYGLKLIGIFGSVARDAQSSSSDIDLVADFDRPIGLRFMEFANQIEELLGVKADILTPAGIDGIRNPRIAQSIRESVIYV